MRYIKLYKFKEDNKRKKDTIDFCFNDKTNYEQYLIIADSSGFNEQLKNSNTEVFTILSTFDKISIALKNNLFDEKIIIEYYGKYFIDFYDIFRYFIIKSRESSKDPDLFIEYEKLVRRWCGNNNYWRGGLHE